MDEAAVEAIISFKAANLAAVEEAKAALGGLGTSVSGLNVHLKDQASTLQTVSSFHVNYGGELTKEEERYARLQLSSREYQKGIKDLTAEENGLARMFGAVGDSGERAFSRIAAAMGTVTGAGATGVVIGAGLVSVGAIVEFGKAAVENAESQERADRSLAQAAAAANLNLASLHRETDSFIAANRSFISNQYDATEAMALFARAGNDSARTTEAMNVTLDLATLKHLSLKDAARMVELAMMGNGRAVRELGIDMKTLSASQDVSEADTKRLEQAQKTAATASEQLSKAQRSLKEEEDALSGKRKVTQTDLDHLKDKQDAVAKAQANLNDANANVKRTQDELNISQAKAGAVLDELSDKLKGGRDATTQLEQSHNRLTQSWQNLSERAGPRLVDALSAIVEGTDKALSGGIRFDDFLTAHGANADQVAGKVVGAFGGIVNATKGVTNAVDDGTRSWGGYNYTVDHSVGAYEVARHAADEHRETLEATITTQEMARHSIDEHSDALRHNQDELMANRDESFNVARANQRVREEVDRLNLSNEYASHTWDEHNQSARETDATLLATNISVQNIRESIAHANNERLDIKVNGSALDDLRAKIQAIFNQQYVLHFQSEHSGVLDGYSVDRPAVDSGLFP